MGREKWRKPAPACRDPSTPGQIGTFGKELVDQAPAGGFGKTLIATSSSPRTTGAPIIRPGTSTCLQWPLAAEVLPESQGDLGGLETAAARAGEKALQSFSSRKRQGGGPAGTPGTGAAKESPIASTMIPMNRLSRGCSTCSAPAVLREPAVVPSHRGRHPDQEGGGGGGCRRRHRTSTLEPGLTPAASRRGSMLRLLTSLKYQW